MSNPREQFEQLELQILAPQAAKSCQSRGRERGEPQCSVRTDFQRDRDRIIHSKAFRRLKHKTQVFIDPEEDHYRTRLTHTLEVSQIARTISRALRLNEDLTEAIALAHDLGHAPFGHAGERALDEVIREYLPDGGFRHPEQSLRVVEVLEKKGLGLNLTYEVRNGILHHSKGKANLNLSVSGSVTLEGDVVRISDRIAYINHDIDDAARDGLICEDSLPKAAVAVLGVGSSERIGRMVEDVIANSSNLDKIAMSDEVREATDILKDYLFQTVYELDSRSEDELTHARNMLTEMFRYYMENTGEIPEMLPELSDSIYSPDPLTAKVQKVTDFISGMTDRYAQRDYAEHFLKWQ